MEQELCRLQRDEKNLEQVITGKHQQRITFKYHSHSHVSTKARYRTYHIQPDPKKDPVPIYLLDSGMFMMEHSEGRYILKGNWVDGMQITLDGFQWMNLLP